MLDLDAFFYVKFFLLSTCQERFQDVSIALDFLDQDLQVFHALAKKSSTRELTCTQDTWYCSIYIHSQVQYYRNIDICRPTCNIMYLKEILVSGTQYVSSLFENQFIRYGAEMRKKRK